jgi:general secretion pathway protein I
MAELHARSARGEGPSRTRRGSARRARGFTLLEVMIALAIISVALVAISGINSGAIDAHTYSKRLTIATLLARSKMADLEQELQSDGLPSDDSEEEGAFDEEGYPQYRWQAQIIRPKTEKIDTSQLLALTGMGLTGADGANPLGGDAAKNLPGDLASKIPGGASALTSALGQGGPTTSGMGGLLGGMMQTQMQGMLDMLGRTVREVRLTVFWKSGKLIDKFTVVTHVVSLGQGTDQVNSAATATGQTPATPTPAPRFGNTGRP